MAPYYDLGWLALALALGFGVIARRGSHPKDAATERQSEEPATPHTRPVPVTDSRLRLIDTPPAEVAANPDTTPVPHIPNPKKTA